MRDDSREALLRSLRNTLHLMEMAGIPKERLLEVLEMVVVELKAELAQRAKKRN